MGNDQQRKEFLQDDGQFRVFIVPVDIMDVPTLTIYEQMVYIVLRSYVNPTDPTAFPSYPTIAKRGRMSRSSAIRAVEGLIKKGLISKEIRFDVSKNHKVKNTSNIYTLIPPKKTEKKKEFYSQTLGVVSDRNGGSVSQTPYHNHLKEPLLNMIDCMHAREELACDSKKNNIYESLIIHSSKNCYIDGFPLSNEYINEIYLMLLNQFPNQLSSEVIEIACNIYFNRACHINPQSPMGVSMSLDLKNPVGFFHNCYIDAVKQFKAQKKKNRLK